MDFVILYGSTERKKLYDMTSLSELNIHTKQLPRKVTVNTLLQIYVGIKENF